MERQRDPTVIVTGGAGYIGSHACKALAAAGYRPVTYDNLSTGNCSAIRWGPLERGDILDAARLDEVFKAHAPVGVLHFAAHALVGESMQAPALYYRGNVVGALNVIEACRAHAAPLVFSSTCAIFGTPERMPIPEDAPPLPINPYGASKLMVERILDDYDMAYGLRYFALRYFNAAGADPDAEIGEAREVETHLIPLAIEALMGRRPPLRIYGDRYETPDGTAIRDYIHVSDLAEAHVRALRLLLSNSPSQRLNLGTGRGYSVREVLDAIAAVAGQPVPHSIAPPRPGDPPQLVAEPGRAGQVLGEYLTKLSTLPSIVETAWAWHKRSGQPSPPAPLGSQKTL